MLLFRSSRFRLSSFFQSRRVVFFHVGLTLAVIFYVGFGALIFYLIEGGNEKNSKEEQLKLRQKSTEKIRNLTKKFVDDTMRDRNRMTGEQFSQRFYGVLNDIGETAENGSVRVNLGEIGFASNESDDVEITKWNYPSSVLFAFTTVTSIGYGHVTIETLGGKIFCIIYGLLGIPLIMIVVGNFGKFSLNGAMSCGKLVRKRFQKHFLKKIRDASLVADESDSSANSEQKDKAWLLLIFILYLILGAILLPLLETWNGLDSFYFSFISLTTIGYGDIVPSNYSLLILTLIYIFVGLGLTVTAIETAGDLFKKVHFFGQPIQGCKDTRIWFGGKKVTTEQLVDTLGKEWGIPPDKIAKMDLDLVVTDLVKELEEGGDPKARTPPPPPPPPPRPRPPPKEEEEPPPQILNQSQNFRLSKSLGLKKPSQVEYQNLMRSKKDSQPQKFEHYFNDHPFYLVRTSDVRAVHPGVSVRCRHCKLALPSPLQGSTHDFMHVAIVHWERYVKQGIQEYSAENDLKPVLVHAWYQCLVGRYSYFTVSMMRIDNKLKENHDQTVGKLLEEQFGIGDCDLLKAVAEGWVESPVK